MQQPEIHTISKVAPPSYAEAMGYPTAPKDDQHVPMVGQSHSQQTQGPPYPSSMPMPMPMPMPTPSYQNENTFCRGNPSQSPYSGPYSTQTPYQSPPGSIATGPHQCVVHTETVVMPHQRRFKDRCCNKKVTVAIICIVLIIYVIKVIISRSA